nr:hypothetical protein [Candidatus Sigynarchaeota archaeon]
MARSVRQRATRIQTVRAEMSSIILVKLAKISAFTKLVESRKKARNRIHKGMQPR